MIVQANSDITPEYVLALEKPASQFLCPIDANIYGIEFIYFKIRNCKNDQVLCEIAKKPEEIGKPMTDSMRTVKYHFGPYFFFMDTIGTTLKFRVGSQPVKDFKMIERHYFKEELIKSYEFDAPFCMPNSINEMEAIYDLPELSEQKKEQMINSPWETVSDSYYFVGNKLIMHTKAEFNYAPFE